jgi:hypothetical protein
VSDPFAPPGDKGAWADEGWESRDAYLRHIAGDPLGVLAGEALRRPVIELAAEVTELRVEVEALRAELEALRDR